MSNIQQNSNTKDNGCTTVEYSLEEKQDLYRVTESDIEEMTDSSAFSKLVTKLIHR
ncbi:hypothetical protein [Haladaptatus sp. DYF46]|uniref:hypothetical protein n=1 Tax=Haladaptatus sp. DYF46 TaxID=2886041 RepID=UPI001E3FF5E4|nr:hypothetical protein [Haladaptatus sp. DYF46]